MCVCLPLSVCYVVSVSVCSAVEPVELYILCILSVFVCLYAFVCAGKKGKEGRQKKASNWRHCLPSSSFALCLSCLRTKARCNISICLLPLLLLMLMGPVCVCVLSGQYSSSFLVYDCFLLYLHHPCPLLFTHSVIGVESHCSRLCLPSRIHAQLQWLMLLMLLLLVVFDRVLGTCT